MNKLKELWEKIKAWFIAKPLVWLKKNWMIITNYLVIFIAYSNIYDNEELIWTETLLGLWLFASAAYGMYKYFMKK